MSQATENLPSALLFEYLQMFNTLVVKDEEFSERLPTTEFELSFSQRGDIYVNQVPLRVNVKRRYEALAGR
jgi:hypothetical protein